MALEYRQTKLILTLCCGGMTHTGNHKKQIEEPLSIWQVSEGVSLAQQRPPILVAVSLVLRTRRHHWLGHIVRMPADRLVRRVVMALGQ